MKIERYSIYKCRVNYRPTYKGRPVKESVKPLVGKVVNLMALWVCEDDENYPGEWAMTGIDTGATEMLIKHGIAWIASGDVEILKELS